MKRWISLLLAAAMTLALLTACGEEESVEETGALKLRIRATAQQTDLDPVVLRSSGGDMLSYHLYENLMRWEDDGSGHAVLGYGAAESYVLKEDVDGSVSYTFTIRKDAEWSDGKSVTSYQFLDAWQRLFEMEEEPAELQELSMVKGFDQAREAKDGTLLTGVSAPDRRTLVITLNSRCAYFLDEFCAGTLTMPIRSDVITEHGAGWSRTAKAVVGNGPYRLKAMEDGQVLMVRSEKYWDESLSGPEELLFTWKESPFSDYSQLLAGEVDFITELPAAEVKTLLEEGTLEPLPVPSVYALLLNNLSPPFDDEFVRQAFAALVDPRALVSELGLNTAHAATGFVPHGISNRDDEWAVAESEEAESTEPVLPEQLLEPEEPVEEPFWDYRAVGDYAVAEEPLSEELAMTRARTMLSQAGYPNGKGFPAVEFLYVDTPQNAAVAAWLQERFQTVLHVEILPKAVSDEEARQLLLSGEFTMAAFRFDAAYDDALAFLDRWRSDRDAAGGNLVGFASRAYDLLLSVVSASNDSAREACLHDAEQLLLDANGVVPLFYYGTTAALNGELQGLYRHAGQDVYFFGGVSRSCAEEIPVEQG